MISGAFFIVASGATSSPSPPPGSTCYDLKAAYKDSVCCTDTLSKVTNYQVSGPAPTSMFSDKLGVTNPCKDTNPGLANLDCTQAVEQAIEQASE